MLIECLSMGVCARYFMYITSFIPHNSIQGRAYYYPHFLDNELGFDETLGQRSDRKQGWHSDLGCLISKCVLLTPML